MRDTVTLEIPAERLALIHRTLALADELDTLACAAPDGSVLDACEDAVLHRRRALQTQLLTDTVARRIGAAEKRGPRSDAARAVEPSKTAGPKNARSSPPSA